jgi:hypothetical protein
MHEGEQFHTRPSEDEHDTTPRSWDVEGLKDAELGALITRAEALEAEARALRARAEMGNRSLMSDFDGPSSQETDLDRIWSREVEVVVADIPDPNARAEAESRVREQQEAYRQRSLEALGI